MNIAPAIYARLSTDAATAAILADRIHPLESPDDVTPFAVYEIGEVPSPAVCQIKEFDVQITVEADTYDGAHAAYDAIDAALDGQWWTAGARTVHSCQRTAPPTEADNSVGTSDKRYEINASYQVFAY